MVNLIKVIYIMLSVNLLLMRRSLYDLIRGILSNLFFIIKKVFIKLNAKALILIR